MKELDWVGSTKERLRRFPKEVRREGGRQLRRVQRGMQPEDWRPMPNVGLGVIEIRLHEPHEHRIIYPAIFQKLFMCSMLLRKRQIRLANVIWK